MKKTLLEITRDILNDLDSDDVTSIDDTIESQQVANIVKQCYQEMISNRNWPHLRNVIQLEDPSLVSSPNYLKIPERVKELKTFSYDKRRVGDTKPFIREVKYKEPDAFLRYVSGRNGNASNVETIVDPSGVSLLIINDCAPMFWTSFDDDYIVTDAYDSDVEVKLGFAKSSCIAYVTPTWTHTDGAYPDLPVEAFAALVEEAKSTSFFVLKQMANQKAEQKAARQQRWLARKAWRAKGGVRYESYGRKDRR